MSRLISNNTPCGRRSVRSADSRQIRRTVMSTKRTPRTPSQYQSPPSQYQSHLRNIRGTFSAEGMSISTATRANLDRIASGQASYEQVLKELRMKYEKRG